MDVSPATPAAAGLSEEDAAALATPFVRALVRQIRSHDTTGVWESKSDTELLEPYVITAEQRRAMPVIADPNAKQLWRLDQYWAAAGLAVEQASGIIATPMIKITHEGFGRAILIAARLVVASRIMRDVHRFGFASLEKMKEEGDKILKGAVARITEHRDVADA